MYGTSIEHSKRQNHGTKSITSERKVIDHQHNRIHNSLQKQNTYQPHPELLHCISRGWFVIRIHLDFLQSREQVHFRGPKRSSPFSGAPIAIADEGNNVKDREEDEREVVGDETAQKSKC
jgi:hypothetical protein